MHDETLERVFNKARMLRELHRAKVRVRQLERQLRGEPAEVEQEREIPLFVTPAPPAETIRGAAAVGLSPARPPYFPAKPVRP
jgi:hypothetical protein